MTLDYYRIFYYVAQYQSFSKAAEILGNNQPNLSRCMNLLESELGCKLLVRTNRGVSLTPEGERLFSHVAIANEQLMLGEQEILKDKSLESGLVTIGASETALRLFLLNKLELFHHNYPHVRLQISNHSTPQAIRALSHGTVDFSVVTTPIDIKKPLHRTSLLSFREILIGGSSYAAIASRMQSLHDLSEVPFISLGAGTGTRELYSQYFLSHHLVFSPDMEASTTDQILPMVAHNLGIGFYPEALASEPIARGEVLPIRLVEPIPEREICLIRDTSRVAQMLFSGTKCALAAHLRARAVCKALFTSPRGAHPRGAFLCNRNEVPYYTRNACISSGSGITRSAPRRVVTIDAAAFATRSISSSSVVPSPAMPCSRI